MLNKDYKEMLQFLLEEKVEFIAACPFIGQSHQEQNGNR